MGNQRRGSIPSELGWLVDLLDSLEERVKTLEAPSGETLGNTVQTLQILVADLQTYLDDYIANDLPTLVANEVASQLAAAFAGNIVIGGSLIVGTGLQVNSGSTTLNGALTATGAITFPNVPATTFVVEPRAVTWVDTSNGRLGRT